jgi:DNA-binding CsgD family transcriptional regulator
LSYIYLIRSYPKIPAVAGYAYIFYRPRGDVGKPDLSYNSEAWSIVANSTYRSNDAPATLPDLYALSARWKTLLDGARTMTPAEDRESRDSIEARFLEVFQSQRRRYAVRGVLLSLHGTGEPQRQAPAEHYLFVLERIVPDTMNLVSRFRQYHLSPREQEVVRLLLADLSNKEIAQALGLSLNTVKGYLKLLTRKLGVSSRTGILAKMLSETKLAS